MAKWISLTDNESLESLIELSHKKPCLIFKHSIRCSISSIAKHRLESDWDFEASELQPFLLDLINYRAISQLVAERFEVHHESPQVLLIREGECTYDASHLDISVSELHECFESTF